MLNEGVHKGSALMKKPELAGRIISAVAEATNAPVTVKMRTGWDKNSLNAYDAGIFDEHVDKKYHISKQEEKENPQSPTKGIADDFIQNMLDNYFKK